MLAFIAVNFPLRTAFAESHKSWYTVSLLYLFQGIFWHIFLFLLWPTGHSGVCYLISIYLSIFQFFSCYWFLVSYHCCYMILTFLNLLRLVLWPNTWAVLENVPCVFGKHVYSVAVGWNVLYMSVRTFWSTLLFK